MKKIAFIFILITVLLLFGCTQKREDYDANLFLDENGVYVNTAKNDSSRVGNWCGDAGPVIIFKPSNDYGCDLNQSMNLIGGYVLYNIRARNNELVKCGPGDGNIEELYDCSCQLSNLNNSVPIGEQVQIANDFIASGRLSECDDRTS